MSRYRYLIAAVAANVTAVYVWATRPRRKPPVDDDEVFFEVVVYQGPTELVMAPAVDGLPRHVKPGDVLIVAQDLAADLVELPSGRWRYADDN